MLEKMKKRRKIENFEIQALRSVVKEGSPNVIDNFKKKFKEIRIEGKRIAVSSSTMFSEQLPRTHYIEAEIEAIYMGTESEARKRFQRNNSFNRRGQSFDGRQWSLSWGSQSGSSRYTPRSRYDGFKSRGKEASSQRDYLQTPAKNTPDFPRCIGYRCQDCNQTKRTCEEIKKVILEKLDVKIVNKVPDPPATVNFVMRSQ